MARRKKKDVKKQKELVVAERKERKRIATKKNMIALAELVGITAAVFVLYRVMMNFRFFDIVLIVYMVAAAACIFGYVIYNRGMSRKNVTPDMLPDSWSDGEKEEFIEDGKRRLEKSKPLLMFIFAFIFTFVMDIIELIAIPMVKSWMGL